METHYLFKERNVPNVYSFGTGSQVKLPGPTRNLPNVYDFGSSYQEIYNDLMSKDPALYVLDLILCFHDFFSAFLPLCFFNPFRICASR